MRVIPSSLLTLPAPTKGAEQCVSYRKLKDMKKRK